MRRRTKEKVRGENREQEKHGLNREEELQARTRQVQEGNEEITLLNSRKMAENKERKKQEKQRTQAKRLRKW